MLLAVMIALVGACGDDDDPASGDPPSGETTSGDAASPDAGDAGETNGAGNEADDADDFPIPRPDGLVLDALADSGIQSPGQRQLYYEAAAFDGVVAFYDEWTTSDGGWMRSESGGIVVYSAVDADRIRTISITPDHDPGAQADGPVTYVLLIDNG